VRNQMVRVMVLLCLLHIEIAGGKELFPLFFEASIQRPTT